MVGDRYGAHGSWHLVMQHEQQYSREDRDQPSIADSSHLQAHAYIKG